MAKEYDGFDHTVAVIKVFESVSWPTAFAAAPQVYCQSTEDKKKSGVDDGTITTTGCDLACETLDMRVLICTAGFESAVTDAYPERDAGQETITASKTYQSFTFNSTFGAAPIVICGHESTTVGGKKFSVHNITTTGGDIAGELGSEEVHWLGHN